MRVVVLAGLLAVSPAHALEPLSPAGNTKGVCRELADVGKRARELVARRYNDEKRSAAFDSFNASLMDLAFGAETRLTFDADNLDTPLGIAEFYQVYADPSTGKELKKAIRRLRGKYGC